MVAFSYRRHAIAPPDVVFYFGGDRSAVTDAYRELTGFTWPGTSCGIANGYAVFIIILSNCRFELDAIIAHEYFHVLQHFLRPWEEWGPLEPVWLTEGTAEYFAARYAFNAERYDQFVAYQRGVARQYPFEATTSDLYAPYVLGFLALDWLMADASDDAHIEYFRRTHELGFWREAFHEAFGMTIDDFYPAFEAYRVDVGALPSWVRGTVLGPAGVRQPNVSVAVCPFYEGSALAPWMVVTTGQDGTFATSAGTHDDRYVLALHVQLEGVVELIGWYEAEAGFTFRYEEATVLTLATKSVEDLVIKLPAEPVPIATVTDCQPVGSR